MEILKLLGLNFFQRCKCTPKNFIVYSKIVATNESSSLHNRRIEQLLKVNATQICILTPGLYSNIVIKIPFTFSQA